MRGARSYSARNRADGNTFGGNDLSRTRSLLFTACGPHVRGDYGLINV